MRIQHNIPALSAYRNYTRNVSMVNKNLEKLSSGYKINRAGDDAAGLAISEKMRIQISGLEQAQNNAKSGINLVQTAEGALTEVHDMLNRMYTLAEQSANGTYADEVDREQLQKEINSLRTEIDRIADATNYNGIKLLDGSLSGEKTAAAVYKDLSSSEAQTLLQIPAEKADGVAGTDTLLEQDKGASSVPTFSVELDGRSFGVKTDATDKIKLTIEADGKLYKSDGTTEITSGLALADNVAGDQLSASDIAKLFDGAVYESAQTMKDGTTKVKFDVKAEGTKLVFTAKNAVDKEFNLHSDVKVEGLDNGGNAITYAEKDAVKGVYEFDLTGNFDGTGTAKIDGVTVAFNVDAEGSAAKFAEDYNKLSGKKFTATASGNKVTLTAIEAGKIDAPANEGTVKNGGADLGRTEKAKGADAGIEGLGGSNNVGTVDVHMVKPGAGERLANTVLTLPEVKDGMKIKLGEEEYTFAVGPDSKYVGTKNVVDLTGLDAATLADKNKLLEAASSKLTEAAAGNKIFSVGHDVSMGTPGMITLQQRSGVKESTDMTTMDGLMKYIGFSQIDEKATAEAQKKIDDKNANPLTLQIGDTAESFNKLTVSIKDMHADAMGIGDIDISTQDGASAAMDAIKNATNYVSDVRGDLGALQNRLDHTINNLSVTQENITDAESTIRDVDIAKEMMAYTKNNILVQSAQAMLAQANQLPQGVLQLLG